MMSSLNHQSPNNPAKSMKHLEYGSDQTAEPDWQAKKASVCNRNAAMLNNELMSDVTFKVGSTSKSIYAHKYVLSTGSSVFYAMFYGKMAEKTSEIKIPDIEPAVFLEFLRYIYCDDIRFTKENAVDILYTAKKYLLSHLSQKCVKYLQKTLSTTNACFLLEQSIFYDEIHLTMACSDFINCHTKKVLSAEGFTKIKISTLKAILSYEALQACEIFIFEMVLRWAKSECHRRKIEPTPSNQSYVLGGALYLIRFPTMTLSEFVNGPVVSKILTPQETIDIFNYLGGRHVPTLKFSTKNRQPLFY